MSEYWGHEASFWHGAARPALAKIGFLIGQERPVQFIYCSVKSGCFERREGVWPALELGGKRIEYQVLRGTSRRYTYFRFRPDLTLEVVLPKGRLGDAGAAISQRREWILEKYEEMRKSRRI